jgi:hypothetical protein
MPAVLHYDRPLAPGTVRITRHTGAVTITIAPDTAKRTVYTVLAPLLLLAAFSLFVVGGLFTRQSLDQLVLLTLFVAIGGWILFRTLRRANRPIVFRADAEELNVHNPLDRPADRAIPVHQIVTLQLRRTALPTNAMVFQLEVLTSTGRLDEQATTLSLLVSPSFETLDKIGRTLLGAMCLPDPYTGPNGWWSDPQKPLVHASHHADSCGIGSSATARSTSAAPPPPPSPDPLY